MSIIKKMMVSINRLLSFIAVLSVFIGMSMLSSCANSDNTGQSESSPFVKADLVVYGKIFTAENNQIEEAFAVKDGKYIYVGDRKGAEAYIEEGKTEVIDWNFNRRGRTHLVMPGCGIGHAHYSMGFALQSVGTIVSRDDDVNTFLTKIVPESVKNAKAKGLETVFGFGYDALKFEKNMPTRQQLDAICSDIPIYFTDEGAHSGIFNTIALVNAGIMTADGTVLKKEISGVEIEMGADGTPTGFLKEQAQTYVRSFLDNDNLFTVDIAKDNLVIIQEHLLAEGYTMYLDGWTTYFFNDNFYKAAQQMDEAGDMKFVIGTTYEIDSWMDVDALLTKAANAKKYASIRVKTNWIKLFMDWSEEELMDITHKANEKGITMQVHVMDNKGVTRLVNAYINGGKDEMRNTLVHVGNVDDADYKRMAQHNIYVTAGLDVKDYPLKSFFDNGVNMSSHNDCLALGGSPDDPFSAMEIAVTGDDYAEEGKLWWTEECLTREQALTALTINCAKQMFIENERGSIKKGKYADFILLDKDVLTCPVNQIHKAKPYATYFEGKRVYVKSNE